jgi:large subunit ribosomal protein L34
LGFLEYTNCIILKIKITTMSFTYKPKKKKRARTHGFLKRKTTKTGRQVLQKRRRKKRSKLAL